MECRGRRHGNDSEIYYNNLHKNWNHGNGKNNEGDKLNLDVESMEFGDWLDMRTQKKGGV